MSIEAIYLLLSLMGYASIFFVQCKINSSSSIFFAISFIVTILYLLGLIDFLKITQQILFYGGLILFAFNLIKNFKTLKGFLISIPTILFIILALWYLVTFLDAVLIFVDSLSYWAKSAKDMFYSDIFYASKNSFYSSYYPPGMQTWQYFITKHIGYSEGHLLWATFLLIISPLLMMYEKLLWKQWYWIILIFLVQFVVIASFGHWIISLYTDHIIGIIFIGIIFTFMNHKFSNKQLLLFIFPFIFLPIIKEAGLFLAGVAILLLILIDLVKSNISIFKYITHNKKRLLIFILLAIMSISSLQIWKIRYNIYHPTHNNNSAGTSISYLKTKIFDIESNPNITKRFIQTIIHQQINKTKISLHYNEFSLNIRHQYKRQMKFTTLTVIIFIFLMLMLNIFGTKYHQNSKLFISITIYMFILFFVYLFIMHQSYIYSFGPRGEQMVSYVRYVNRFILPMILISFAFFMPFLNYKDKTILKYNHSMFKQLIIVFILFIAITRPYISPMLHTLQSPQILYVKSTVNEVLPKLKHNTKLLISFPDTYYANIIRQRFKYYMTPFIRVDLNTNRYNYQTIKNGNYDYFMFINNKTFTYRLFQIDK